MRAFIAIELPQNIKNTIGRLQTKLKASSAGLKWVDPSNIHLTLKFLGDIDEKSKDGICTLLKEICGRTPLFTIKLQGLSAFPSIQSPRIIWIGLSQGHDQLKAIVDQIENSLRKYGICNETKPFSWHITIARVHSQKNVQYLTRDMAKMERESMQEFREFQAGNITLFKSTLLPQGPIYEIIQQTNLKTT